MIKELEIEMECGRCGKKIDFSKGAYGLALIEVRPEYDRLFPGEDALWCTKNFVPILFFKQWDNESRKGFVPAFCHKRICDFTGI